MSWELGVSWSKLIWAMVGTYKGLLRLCEWTLGGDFTSRWWGHISRICHKWKFSANAGGALKPSITFHSLSSLQLTPVHSSSSLLPSSLQLAPQFTPARSPVHSSLLPSLALAHSPVCSSSLPSSLKACFPSSLQLTPQFTPACSQVHSSSLPSSLQLTPACSPVCSSLLPSLLQLAPACSHLPP